MILEDERVSSGRLDDFGNIIQIGSQAEHLRLQDEYEDKIEDDKMISSSLNLV